MDVSENSTICEEDRSFINLMEINTTSNSIISTESSANLFDLNEENVHMYLTQYQPAYDLNPSDDSDFEETSYATDLQYENKKKQEKAIALLNEQEIEKERKAMFKRYFDTYKNKMKSIFNLKGIQFTHFNHRYIFFVFTPSVFCKKYICAHRKFYVSLKYKTKWWNLKRFQVPNKTKILKMFNNKFIDDKNLMKVLEQIYVSLVAVTREQINTRKRKHKKYLLGQDVDFNSDDERLLLTPDERIRRKNKLKMIWNRMLPPSLKINNNIPST